MPEQPEVFQPLIADDGVNEEVSAIEQKLKEALRTVHDRELVYGVSSVGHERLGKVMAAMMGEVTLRTAKDMVRFHLLVTILGKLCRYTHNFESGGHTDSIHDAGNYCFLLEVEDDDSA